MAIMMGPLIAVGLCACAAPPPMIIVEPKQSRRELRYSNFSIQTFPFSILFWGLLRIPRTASSSSRLRLPHSRWDLTGEL